MASRKEYELLFQLNASLNGGFSASFQKAQQKIVELQREIDKLSKIQSDIGAYEKQQAAVEKTASKLETLKKQHDNIQREYEETGEASSDLQNKLLAKEEQIKNTSKALEEQQKKLEATGDALKEAGVDTANLTEESKRLEEEMGALKDQQEETAKNARTFGDKAAQAFEAAGNALIASGIMDGLQKVYDGFMDCVSVAADFQESMSNVKALSQASNSEMSAAGASSTKLGALGVLTEELGVNFYDAEGNVRDFTTVPDETRVAWAKLSAEEQASYGKTIAGQYAVSAWLALMNATSDSVDKVRYSIDNCTGAAERMSKIKLDNPNGQIALFDSAWEAAQTTVGEQATPALQGGTPPEPLF